MSKLKLFLLTLIVLSSPNCDESEQIANYPIKLNIGNDTTIIYGDTLFLDAGPGFISYIWNDSISDQEILPVTEAGRYWIVVTDSLNRKEVDSIHIDTVDLMLNDSCINNKYVVYLNRYYLKVPCSYSVTDFIGGDSHIIDIRSENQDIVFGYEEHVVIDRDTLFQIPDWYRSTPFDIPGAEGIIYPFRKIIKDNKDQVIGILYYKTTLGTIRNMAGIFFYEVNSYYLELFHCSYASSNEKELIEILKTIKYF